MDPRRIREAVRLHGERRSVDPVLDHARLARVTDAISRKPNRATSTLATVELSLEDLKWLANNAYVLHRITEAD